MEAVAADSLLSDVVELTRPSWQTRAQSEGRNIYAHCEATDAPNILDNAAQLREALTNLALNAVDAMPRRVEGSVLISRNSKSINAVIRTDPAGVRRRDRASRSDCCT